MCQNTKGIEEYDTFPKNIFILKIYRCLFYNSNLTGQLPGVLHHNVSWVKTMPSSWCLAHWKFVVYF